MPIAVPNTDAPKSLDGFTSQGKPFKLAPNTRTRLENCGVDLSKGYPYFPPKPKNLAEALRVRSEGWEHIDAGSRASKDKKALFGAAKEVINLTTHIGTEIVGLQLAQLTNEQKDDLALLIAERTVVFFRDQEITPREQLELGAYFGVPEVHPTAAQVPGVPGVSIISDQLAKLIGQNLDYRNPFGTQNWHTDLTHEIQPPGVTHLHLDAVPPTGGDTFWASGYSAYDKLSPEFQKLIESLNGLYRSQHKYPDPVNPEGEKKPIINAHPIVRVHPVTGWKSLFVNRRYTVGIQGMEHSEAMVLLNYLFDVYEKSLDIQVRFRWTPKTSALWDNRISIHAAVYDYGDEETDEPRHGTRVSSLAEKPFFTPNSVGRREALGLAPGGVNELPRDDSY